MRLTPFDSERGIYVIEDRTNGHLVVRGDRSLLIDCPSAGVAELCARSRLPTPDAIIHTQVQAEHCLEWNDLGRARVFVAEASREIAIRSKSFFDECRTVWPPAREWDERGAEKYGFAGCTTERPPARALNVAGTLTAGDVFRWQDVELEVLALPGSGARAIGFFWREAGVLFSGDLMREGGYLVNMYDLERSYGLPTGYDELRSSLGRVSRLGARVLLPTSGAPIEAPDADAARLLRRIEWVFDPQARRRDEPVTLRNYDPLREFGRYAELAPGIFQNTNGGNAILFVDADRRAMIVDPDPCIWESWEESCREVRDDLDLLEREAGFETIDVALLTHYHGDHVEYVDLLRERYGTSVRATPDVAGLLARPGEAPYPCTVDWYAFPFDHVDVDETVEYDRPFRWGDVSVTPIDTPGHCLAHTGYLVEWRGRRVVCTGDTLQYGGGPIAVPLPIIYNDTAWPDRGAGRTFDRLVELRPDLVVCGHSQSFGVDVEGILRDFAAVARDSERSARGMIHDGDTMRAMTPPGYDDVRPMANGRVASYRPLMASAAAEKVT